MVKPYLSRMASQLALLVRHPPRSTPPSGFGPYTVISRCTALFVAQSRYVTTAASQQWFFHHNLRPPLRDQAPSTGFEPAPSGLKGQCRYQLDHDGMLYGRTLPSFKHRSSAIRPDPKPMPHTLRGSRSCDLMPGSILVNHASQ